MAWFRRSSAADTGAASSAPQNPHLQALKRQARNRLIGMVVLVLAGIAVFTWVLDTEPRHSDREIVYEIPARGENLSVRVPAAARAAAQAKADPDPKAQASSAAPRATGDTPEQIRARRRAALAEGEELLDEAPLAAGSDEPQPDKAQLAAEQALKAKADKAAAEKAAREKAEKAQQAKAEREAAAKQAKAKADKDKADKAEKAKADKSKAEEAARARALLEGKAVDAAPATPAAKAENKAENKAEGKTERTVVQFGSFADAAKAAEVRRKVEAAGLKTYAQEIDTPRGKLVRLRVGPYTKPQEAEAAAKKIKALGLPAAILTL